MSITAGKRRHVNICASALTLCLPPLVPLPHSEQRREIQEEGILLSLVWIKLEQDLHPPFSRLIFTNSGKQLILKLIRFSTTSRGESSQITSVKLLWCALYSSCFNVKKTSNIYKCREERKRRNLSLFVTRVRQKMEEIIQNCKGIWGFPDTKIQELLEDNLEAGKPAVLQGVRIFTNWESKWFSLVQESLV